MLAAILKVLTVQALIKGAVALAMHLATLATAQTFLAYEAGINGGPPHLYRVDADSGQATLVAPTTGLHGEVISLDARAHQLFAITRSGAPGSYTSQLAEIDPCTGALIASHPITLDGAPAPGHLKSLAHDAQGRLIAAYAPTQSSPANTLAALSDTGELTPLRSFSGALDDFDGLCPVIIDAGSDGNVTYAGLLAMNRDPDTQAAHLLRIDDGADATTLLASHPFSATLEGVNDLTLFSGLLFAADTASRRIHRLDPASGQLVGHAELSPALAFSAITPFQTIVFTAHPASANACVSTDAFFSITAFASGPVTYQWQLETSRGVWHTLTTDPQPLPPFPSGGTVSAATPDAASTTVSLRGRPGRVLIRAVVTGPCDTATSNLASLFINSADFDNDGDSGTDADIEAFFACIAGSCPATGGSADFNADGDSGTDADIESFFRVLAGGPC
jgi:hypothetical protein